MKILSNRRNPMLELIEGHPHAAAITGLKPELGNGYADFSMDPNLTYTVQLGAGSDIASGLSASSCQAPEGETFPGGIKLTFQQP
jgi:hypothetical protein